MFFWLMEPDELSAHLAAEERFYAEQARALRELTEAKDRGEYGVSPQTQSIRVAAEAGVRLFQALADWAAWAREHAQGANREGAPGDAPGP